MPRTVLSPEFARNYGFWSEDEQRALIRSTVAICGAGGGGFQFGLKLARMGVSSFSIADPETFEPQNANRVDGAAVSTYGRNKAEVFRDRVLDINPDARVAVFTEGVTPESVDEFIAGAHLVVDESESTQPEIGVLVARAARARGIPDLMAMNVGFAAQVTSFAPSGPWTFERFMGLDERMPLDEIAEHSMDLARSLPYVPPYSDLRALAAVRSRDGAGESVSLPSLAIGIDLLSSIASAQAFLHLTRGISVRRPSPVWAPRIAYMDSYRFRARVLRSGRISHLRHLVVAAARQRLGRNPSASYAVADIDRRRVQASSES
ncbi:ThiF family adenylyltransferase [Agreia pratensis]|uniref:Molybdopterin or thiamine biosynthesis adenylyltransferase n=1 Tax=Agreia pratensis TaxID=150121 RepID=A0A1X7IGF2_9MICO|nr:ThiF family adenylyltransferase [Agreia pratensis]MBF4633215.1 ThiF family adenylyltransferase [Agreia pratensis]SMG13836.1 Molybdopterin or thiamine biosynthesis adenylyltransferase [Agreia pratensis]